MTMTSCDKCGNTIAEFNGARASQGYTSPGFGSKYDCDSEQIFVELPDGVYCYDCLDTAIDETPITHLIPRFKHEALGNLFNCDCDLHAGLRQKGGENLRRLFDLLSS
jgi:hypothetical protein